MAAQHRLEGRAFQILRAAVNIQIRRHLFDNVFRGRVWTTNPNEYTLVSLHAFQQESEAKNYKSIFEQYDSSQKYEIDMFDGQWVLISDIPQYSLREWLASKVTTPWEYNADQTECLGFNSNTKEVLRCIGRRALSILSAGGYHGNLNRSTIRVDDNNLVKIVNSTYDANDLKAGILKDLSDFKQIVIDIANQNQCTTNTPKALELFDELYKLLNIFSQAASLDVVREFAFFIFNNPLFWSNVDRHSFLELGWNLKRRANTNKFNKALKFDKQPLNMNGWRRRIRRNSNLCGVLNFKMTATKYSTLSYHYDYGFFDFQRNARVHYQDTVKWMTLLAIERETFEVLPETCAVMFYGLVELSMMRKTYFRTMFGEDLVTLLAEEPTPCH